MIDREGPVPPYLQLYAILKQRIDDGEIQPGRRIPSLVELEDEFGLARDTIQKATRKLREDGYIVSVPGLGLFVVDRS